MPSCYTFKFHVQKLERVQKRRGAGAGSKQAPGGPGGKQDEEEAVLFLQAPTPSRRAGPCASSRIRSACA